MKLDLAPTTLMNKTTNILSQLQNINHIRICRIIRLSRISRKGSLTWQRKNGRIWEFLSALLRVRAALITLFVRSLKLIWQADDSKIHPPKFKNTCKITPISWEEKDGKPWDRLAKCRCRLNTVIGSLVMTQTTMSGIISWGHRAFIFREIHCFLFIYLICSHTLLLNINLPINNMVYRFWGC